jgi:hypothetical protein
MKNLFSRAAVIAVAVFSVHPATAALNPAFVGADAQWVVYADLNALRASVVGKEAIAAFEKAQVQATDGKIGIDIPKLLATVGTVTAYGANLSPDPQLVDGTLLVQGTADLPKIAEAMLLQATMTAPDQVTELKDLPFPAYAVSPGRGNKNAAEMQVFVAFPPEPIVLVSKSKPQLLRAREIFRGAEASAAKSSTTPLKALLGNSEQAFFFAASVVPSDKLFGTEGPQARVLQMTNSGSVAIGENGKDTFAHVKLLANSDEMADKLQKILLGMTAMLSLAETNDAELKNFMNSATVSRDNRTVSVNLAYSSERLGQMVQQLQQTRQNGNGVEQRLARRDIGRVASEWIAVMESGDIPPQPVMAWHSVDGVHLETGTAIIMTGWRNGGKGAHFDRIEVAPMDGSTAPLVFQSDYMKLVEYRLEDLPAGLGGGKMVSPRSQRGMAMIQFPGAPGEYRIRVHYMAEPDGRAIYTLSLKDPVTATAAPSNDQPANRGGR